MTYEELTKEDNFAIFAKVEFQKVTEDAHLPEYSRAGDAAMDCYANVNVTVPPFTLEEGLGRVLVPLGFKVAIPKGWVGDIRPRSGLALKNGITVLNTPGTIDSNYRGEVGAILVNTTTKPFEIKKGERVCQMICHPIFDTSIINKSQYVWVEEVDELDSTNRGEGGFGSSGK